MKFTGKTSDQRTCKFSRSALAEAYVDKRVAGKKESTKYRYHPTSAGDLCTFEGADSSVASTWFGLRHARLKSCSPSTYSGFEIWVLRFRVLGASFSSLGRSIFEFWVLRFRDLGALFSSFGCFVFEINI